MYNDWDTIRALAAAPGKTHDGDGQTILLYVLDDFTYISLFPTNVTRFKRGKHLCSSLSLPK